MRSLAEEFAAHGTCRQRRFASVQYALLGRLFAAQQQAFESMTPAERMWCQAEGVQRLYLGTRSGLPFHDTFAVVGTRAASGNVVDGATRAIAALGRLVDADPVTAARLRCWRRAVSGCDRLESGSAGPHFALLRGGELFMLPLSLAADQSGLRTTLERIVRRPLVSPRLSLGEGSALPRERWAAIEATLPRNSAASRALEALRRAVFLVCLDDTLRRCSRGCDGATCDDLLSTCRFAERYFDKAVQIVVTAEGSIALLGEHGAIDGGDAVELIRRLQQTTSNVAHVRAPAASERPVPQPLQVDMADALGEPAVRAARAWLIRQSERAERRVERWSEFPCAAFERLDASIDALVQIGVQVAFRRCTGRLPSVHEPVRPAPGSGRRLAFVSPVSEASARLDDALRTGRPRAGAVALAVALEAHRAAVRRGREGRDGPSRLLALGVVEFPVDAARDACTRRGRERLFGGLSRALAHLVRRDLTVSCGGYGEPVSRFGTIAHRSDMGAIGYVVDDEGLALDTLLHGRLREELSGETFAATLRETLHEVLACRQLGSLS